MEISALHTDLKAPDVPLERLAGNRSLSEEQKVAEASRQFEAILLRQILESTQKTVIPSEFSDNSTASGIYRDMITAQLADGRTTVRFRTAASLQAVLRPSFQGPDRP